MLREGVALAALGACLLAAGGVAQAKCKKFGKSFCWHTVQKGDTLALLGAEYYGDRDHGIFIMVANKILHERPLKPGTRLKIPLSREVTVNVGETLATLAEEYLGNPERDKFLAFFNDMQPETSLATGQTVWIPLQVQHTAAGAESLDAIAAAYFKNRKRGEFLKAYNFWSSDKLKPGETIDVPIYHVRMQRTKLPPPDEESEARARERQAMQKLAKESLATARTAWRQGDYRAVKRELTQIKSEYLDTDQAVAVGVLLGAAYVAFDDQDSALATFGKVLERRPGHALRRYDWSPKVREVWVRASGKVSDERPAARPAE